MLSFDNVTFWQLRQFDTLREKCTKTEYFKSLFPHIGTEWEDLLCKSRIRKNTDQKKLRIWALFTQWQVICFVFHLSMGLRNFVFVKTINSVPSFSFWTEKCNLKVINTGFSQVNRKKAALKMSIFSEICGTFIFHVWFIQLLKFLFFKQRLSSILRKYWYTWPFNRQPHKMVKQAIFH